MQFGEDDLTFISRLLAEDLVPVQYRRAAENRSH
jgi:uncharacterized protein involved in type VI secretion and phage assembly